MSVEQPTGRGLERGTEQGKEQGTVPGIDDADIVEERIRFRSDSLSLEGVLSYPGSGMPLRAVLLCPPHPHFAGDIDNNVVRALGRSLAASSVVLRFNYRGVGASTIDLPAGVSVFDYWTEVEERQRYEDAFADVRTAARELVALAGDVPLTLVGYSFGSIVALLHGREHPGASRLVGICPPLTRFDFTFLADCPVPCLLVSGDRDFVYSADEMQRTRAVAGPRLQGVLMPGQDHFFRGTEILLCRRVAGFLDGATGAEDGGVASDAF